MDVGELREELMNRERVIRQLETVVGSPLHAACLANDKPTVAALLNSGVDVDTRDLCFGATPLMAAVTAGNRDIVEYLIQVGLGWVGGFGFGFGWWIV